MPDDRAAFWNDRYAAEPYVYGTHPNAFVAAQAERFPPGGSVLEPGAGEGRNAVWLARRGHAVTVLDQSEVGLQKARRLAERHGVVLATTRADVTTWEPTERWDVVVVTFLHLPAAGRPAFYRLLRRALAPGGLLVAEWFRPEQITRGLPSGGPPSLDLMVTADELRHHFDAAGLTVLEEADPVLDEGPHHQGRAAVVRMVWRAPDGPPQGNT